MALSLPDRDTPTAARAAGATIRVMTDLEGAITNRAKTTTDPSELPDLALAAANIKSRVAAEAVSWACDQFINADPSRELTAAELLALSEAQRDLDDSGLLKPLHPDS
jgi:hypothetical protein